MAWHVIFSGVGGGANQVRSWQTLLCYFLFVFFSVSFNHPDHRMLGVLSLVWPFFSPLCTFCLDVTLSYGFSVILCWHCCTRSSLLPTGFLCGEQGQLFSCGLWTSHCSGFSCCGARALGLWASVTAVHRLSCPMAYGIFLDHQISNPCLPRWQVNSFPPPGKSSASSFFFLKIIYIYIFN